MSAATTDRKPLGGKLFGTGPGGGEVCTVRVQSDALQVTVGNREWRLPLDEVELSYGGADMTKLVAACRQGDAPLSLYLPREEAVARLRAVARPRVEAALRRQDELLASSRRRGVGLWLLVLGGGLLTLWFLLVGIDRVIGWTMAGVPRSWEVTLGRKLVESMYPADAAVRNPAVVEPVQDIAGRLLEHVDADGYQFRVRVIPDEQVNAFAVPGGEIVVLTGLLEEASGPEEVAGVLAHEIQHVLRRHSLRRIFDHLKWHLVVTLVLGDLETVTEVILARASGLLTLAHDRAAEREADRLGLELLRRARVDPRGLVRFFERLHAEQGELAERLAFLTTHPGSSERVQYLNAELGPVAQREWIPLDVDWEGLQAALKEVSR